MKNYRTSLEWELQEKREQMNNLASDYSSAETRMIQTEKRVDEAKHRLKQARSENRLAAESFRDIHREVSSIKQMIGELQTELFSSGEEEDKWFHQ